MKNFDNFKKTLLNDTEYLEFNRLNSKGEKMNLVLVHNQRYGKNSLPYLWYKSGYTGKELNNYIIVQTEVVQPNGDCRILYNPQIYSRGGRFLINFKWLFEDTEKNRQRLIDKVASLFYRGD